MEIICEKLKLQSDVAGATFMAFGSSAPELFASIIGKFSSSIISQGWVVQSLINPGLARILISILQLFGEVLCLYCLPFSFEL